MNKIVQCTSCGMEWKSEDLEKSCGNCFACTGCEMWVCPSCDSQIVIVPPGKH